MDHCLALDAMANLLSRLSREPAPEQGESPVPDDMNLEVGVAGLDPSVIHSSERPGELSHFTCPECTGPLYQIEDGNLVRFRCRVGLAYTAESMLDEKTEALEGAFYAALNSLEENALIRGSRRPRASDGPIARRSALRDTGPRLPRTGRDHTQGACGREGRGEGHALLERAAFQLPILWRERRPNPVLDQREPAAREPVDPPQGPRTVRFRRATRRGGSRGASSVTRAYRLCVTIKKDRSGEVEEGRRSGVVGGKGERWPGNRGRE